MRIVVQGRKYRDRKDVKYDPAKEHKLMLQKYKKYLTGVSDYTRKWNLSKIKQAVKLKKELIRRATPYEVFLHEYFRTQKIMVDFQKIVFIEREGRIKNFYVLDIFLPHFNTVVEVDGKYHDLPYQKIRDEMRTLELKELGYKVFRCRNEETFNVEKLHQRLIEEGGIK